MRDQIAPDLQIAAIADRQGGVISTEQLHACGLSKQAIERRRRAGRLHPIHRGVYAVGHRVVGVVGHRWAAVLSCGEGAALSDGSAGDAWGLRAARSLTMHVTVASRAGRARRDGIRVHRRILASDEVTTLDGLPITTPARTLLDLAAAGLRGRALEAALDRAERQCKVDWSEVRRLLDRHAGRAGVPGLEATLARYAPGTVDTQSRLEEIVLELCDDHGIPRPQTNVVVEGAVRDFFWPDARLVVEADGYGYHRSPSAFNDDRERDVRLTLAGFVPLRFTYDQCAYRRDYVRAAILGGLAARAGRAARRGAAPTNLHTLVSRFRYPTPHA
jgi:very-short-patch-repair endonuclease